LVPCARAAKLPVPVWPSELDGWSEWERAGLAGGGRDVEDRVADCAGELGDDLVEGAGEGVRGAGAVAIAQAVLDQRGDLGLDMVDVEA